MDENGRRRGIPGPLYAVEPGPGRKTRRAKPGDPNVLSDAATPNRLSSEVARPTGILGGTREPVPGSLRPVGTAARPLRRAPSLTTLLFFGFLAFTALRFAGQLFNQSTPAPPAPLATTAPEAATPGPATTDTPVPAGTVAFGTASDGSCGVTGVGVVFNAGTAVWWSAELTSLRSGDSGAIVIVRRDGNEISSEKMPPAEPAETWDLLCSTEPVAETGIGTYAVEVWDLGMNTLLATGEYRVSG